MEYHFETDNVTPAVAKKLENMFYWCHIQLGGSSIPVQLEDDDYKVALDEAVTFYRTRSSRSVWQTYAFLELEVNRTQYELDSRIDSVFRVLRNGGFSGIGTAVGGFESFGAATVNTLLRGGLGTSASGSLNIATYDFLMQYQETLDRLFAREIHFSFRPDIHTIFLYQVPTGPGTVALQCSVIRSIDELMNDNSSMQWLRRYTLAATKCILGEKLSLFSTMPGAQGGTVLKGNDLKQKGDQEKVLLEQEILDFGDNSSIPLIIRG